MESPLESTIHEQGPTSAQRITRQMRLRSNDNDHQSSHAAKRQRIAIDNSIYGPSVRFQHEDYTVAWICALHIEMAAARAMLDNIHDGLPMAPDDTNSYTLGNVGQHNIVIAGLPAGYYGLNNAATVASNIERSFPSLHIRLMVGIGGGAPGKLDLRLGDIVVGIRVMQYDFGKIVGDGVIERTSFPIIPPSKLLTHITKLRAIHESTPSRVPSILQAMHNRYPAMTKYARPTSQDQLFLAKYHHNPAAISCDECDSSMLVHRLPRINSYPKIHYEAIASSNQVMKHGITRDEIAKGLQVVCFEMEAAGLANFPCLVIRGICDYSDSHKNKQWQEYAAAVAAAYAKEFLEAILIPESKATVVQNTDSRIERETSQNLRKQFLTSLRFEQIDSRQSNIKAAHTTTCKWLLKSPEYLAWMDPKKFSEHHGFLWLSGKPGTGKSTMMKYVYTNAKRTSRASAAVVSFFFNARGDYLEKSTTGMYRSLLLQLLERFPYLQRICDDSSFNLSNDVCPALDTIQTLLRKAISMLGQRSLTCFIDALDECDEQQVRDMVEYFEELGQRAVEDEVGLRICFSSRHYPYIFIRNGVRLTLEDQKDHENDLRNYVQGCLRADPGPLLVGIQAQILQKAAGVFMWVILVVDILNKEFQRGRMFAVKKRLEEIPDRLSDLFKDILRRDNENMEDLLLCLQWILFAKRPLTRDEFYFAVSTGLFGEDEDPTDHLVTSITSQSMDRFVISSSKGLAEVTKSKHQTVQFIHESVRDFLIKDDGLQELWPELSGNFESFSHDRLKQCCRVYLQLDIFASVLMNRPFQESGADVKEFRGTVSKKFPFLEYATQQILHHANMAASTISQSSFLAQFPIYNWIIFHNIFEIYGVRRYTPKASLFYILADNGFTSLIKTNFRHDSQIYVLGERYRYPLFAALINGHEESVQAFLGQGTEESITEDLGDIKNRPIYKEQTPLLWAILNGHEPVAKLLIEKGADVHMSAKDAKKALFKAVEKGYNAIIRLLIEKSVDINATDKDSRTALMIAIERKHDTIVRLLIDSGVDVHAKGKDSRTALLMAAEIGSDTIVRLLVANGADVNAKDKNAKTALLIAVERGRDTTARLLIEEGADINTRNNKGQTALLFITEQRQITRKRRAIAQLLIEKGAETSIRDLYGSTVLLYAIENSHFDIISLLIETGAYVDYKDESGQTLLFIMQRFVEPEGKLIFQRLIDKGADVNVKNNSGNTALCEAVVHKREDMIKLLIENSADPNIQNHNGQTALWVAYDNEAAARLLLENGADPNIQDNDGETALWVAYGNEAARLLLENGADPSVQDDIDQIAPWLYKDFLKLLIKYGADLNVQNNLGQTALWVACCFYRYNAFAKLLLENGADPNIQDNDGQTALYVAKHEAVIKQLLENGADPKVQNNNGQTALWAAGNEAIAKLLLQNGADPNVQDNDGQTALWAIRRYDSRNVVKLLLQNGADPNVQDNNGQTALWAAGNEAIAQLLLQNGADPNVQDNDGQTALWAIRRYDSRNVVKLLLQNGADPNMR
ncbi:pfs, nacht and ankyrin domain [Trichoderma arundinaceum]|uniref:Pfs, nacht and ankyrin domain n=1 Tax=Trichoderma arundinaceum TaxID=490622 RepID=A0A395NT63_TRIAR|nr:pfs, nacht and ankyrin domain [Trichoderma arundinaceum]